MTILGSLNQETDFSSISEISQLSNSVQYVENKLSASESADLSSSITTTNMDQAGGTHYSIHIKKWFAAVADLSNLNPEQAVLTAVTYVQRINPISSANMKIVATRDSSLASPFNPANVITESPYQNVPNTSRAQVKFVFDDPISFTAENTVNDVLYLAFKKAEDGSLLSQGISMVETTDVDSSDAHQNPAGPVSWSSGLKKWFTPFFIAHVKYVSHNKVSELDSRVDALETIVNGLPAVIDAI